MLDFRLKTFLALCKLGNYTKTAEKLHITQPAVSQHIKYLEEYYESQLFLYEGRKLRLTEKGIKLQEFATAIQADADRIKDIIVHYPDYQSKINFGVTLTIGEFIMPDLIQHIMTEDPQLHINMTVNNTSILLEKLSEGEIDFAFVEGCFDCSGYETRVFAAEEFVCVAASGSHLARSKPGLADLKEERLILRENGSGTRDVFEQNLAERNLSIKGFEKVVEIGNISCIKSLVQAGLGITFLYKQAVQKELEEGTLCIVEVDNFNVSHEFNFVYLKNSLHTKEYSEWFHYFQKIKNEEKNKENT